MRAGARVGAALLGGALVMGWALPASANEPAPAPAVEPSSEGALPSYADVVVAEPHTWDEVAATPRPVPRDGRGRLVIGSAVLVGGAAMFAGSVALAVEGHEVSMWASTIVTGTGAAITGSLLLVGGSRRLRAYREWESARPDVVPRQGHGLIGSGAVLMVLGVAGGMFGTIGWAASRVGYQEDERPLSPLFPAMLGVGIGSLAVGSTLTILGVKQHDRFEAWRSGPQLLPGISPLRGGAQIGLSGRF